MGLPIGITMEIQSMCQDHSFKTEFSKLSEAIKARNAVESCTTILAEHLFNSAGILSSPYLKNWGGCGCFYHCELVFKGKCASETKKSSSTKQSKNIKKIVVDYTLSCFMWNDSVFFATLHFDLTKYFRMRISWEIRDLCHKLNKNIFLRSNFLGNDIIYAETFEDFDMSQAIIILEALHELIAEKAITFVGL